MCNADWRPTACIEPLLQGAMKVRLTSVRLSPEMAGAFKPGNLPRAGTPAFR